MPARRARLRSSARQPRPPAAARTDVDRASAPTRAAGAGIADGSPTPREAGRTRRPATREGAVLAATLDPIVTIDARGTIQSASDSVQRVLGWTPAELVGRNVNVLMPEPHRSAHDGYLATYHRTGRTNILNRPRRFEALRRDGSVLPIELCVSRAEMPDGATALFVGIIRDMSVYAAAERTIEEERVRHRQLLAEQTAALQQANNRVRIADRMASIGTLAAGLGHDMNNVLLPVRARLNALRASGASGSLPRADRRHVGAIQKSVDYLQQLADGLHFLALDPDAEADVRGVGAATDLRQWWSQVGPLLSKAVPRHVRVSASFASDLPRVALAPHALTQAVLNLVVNAGEAIPPRRGRRHRRGCVRIWAEAARDAEGMWVRLGVTDNGSGMSDEVKRRAFEMFFTTKRRGLGTGLGLALVHRLMERAGGSVDVESAVGEGTTVVMIVPVAGADRRPGPATGRSGAAVRVADGRAAGLVRHLLEASGVTVQPGDDRAGADIWVVDPAIVPIDDVRRWRRARPEGRLVIFGGRDRRSMRAWTPLRPIVIEATDDLESVRAALGRAVLST